MTNPQGSKLTLAAILAVGVLFLSGIGAETTAQTPAAVAPAVEHSKFAYKGISIGSTTEQVRDKLGDPKDKSDAQDMYVFSDEESAQFIYDANGAVTAVVLTFSVKASKAPSVSDVLGQDVPANAEGGIYKMIRYPKAGYWISYNRIPGDDGIVSIAMQKI